MFLAKVINALNSHKVKYALVGGYAVALHGAVRGTIDVDLIIGLNKKQFLSCEDALKSIGLTPKLPITAENVFQFRQEYIKNRNLIAWSFVNPNNPIEIVDIIITEDLTQMRTIKKPIGNIKVNVLSKEDLIQMKRRSNRKQDKEDIKALKSLL